MTAFFVGEGFVSQVRCLEISRPARLLPAAYPPIHECPYSRSRDVIGATL